MHYALFESEGGGDKKEIIVDYPVLIQKNKEGGKGL
jgi:hypothetical protein